MGYNVHNFNELAKNIIYDRYVKYLLTRDIFFLFDTMFSKEPTYYVEISKGSSICIILPL